jgi:hypothetical protein
MRERAQIQFSGRFDEAHKRDIIALTAAWNARSDHPIRYGGISVYRDDPLYSELRSFFDTWGKGRSLTWGERIYIEYSDEELLTFEVLALHPVGRAGRGGNTYAAVYEYREQCPVCKSIEPEQISDLVLDLEQEDVDEEEIPYLRHDLCQTDCGQLVISQRLKALFATRTIPGVTVRPVRHVWEGDTHLPAYYQVNIAARIGPAIAPCPIQRSDACATCSQYKQAFVSVLPGTKGSEFCFPRSSCPSAWIMETMDRFGQPPHLHGLCFISQELYRFLKRSGLTGFWVQPAHWVD